VNLNRAPVAELGEILAHVFSVVATYEQLFLRVKWLVKDETLGRYTKQRVLRAGGIRLRTHTGLP
jgi:hypothetical protein